MDNSYLPSVIKQFEYYKSLGDKTFHQLTEEQLFYQHNNESNSIAIIVKHIVGNMLSRWTNFLTEDGEKEWRNRDDEFVNTFNKLHQIPSQKLIIWQGFNKIRKKLIKIHIG